MTVGRRDRPPRPFQGQGARGVPGPVPPIPAILVGDGAALREALERVGAAPLVEVVAVLGPGEAAAPDAAAAGASLVVALWPSAIQWLRDADPASPLGGSLPILLVGGDPIRARLVDTPGASLAAALHAAASGPLGGLASELATLRDENRQLKASLEARKAIERAKGILMEQEGITEGEAFTRIQRLSMTRRKTMKEVAEAIILSREASGD